MLFRSVIDAPSGGALKQAPRWDLMDIESYGGGIRVLALYLVVWGYVGIYRRKEYVAGASRGPRGRGARPRGGALQPCDRLMAFLTKGPCLLDLI